MCGIAGIWYFDRERPVDPALLRAMTEQLIHRGPDEDGCYTDGSIGLGFRRLSIIDVAGSHQPMPNENQRCWIVFNGEIYNFQELRARLAAKHTFQTRGDTETILHAYEDDGPDCVQHLRGMFAFAVWDAGADTLTLAVDRFGKKPIYYLADGEKFIFASELKALLQHPGLKVELDLEALDEYLYLGYVPAPRTIFQQIRKLPPAHTLVVKRDGSLTPREYWHPHFIEPSQYDTRPLPELAAELRHLLTEAVRLRMISDVPLGAFLSGGVDSSAVVALMSQVSSQPVKTFAIGFDESGFDETHYAQEVADFCHTDHTREVVRPDVVAILPKLIHQYDEPFADSSMIPTYYVAQAARQHVTVALSGDGGDEIFAGYHRYRNVFRHLLLQRIIPARLRPLAGVIGRRLPKRFKIGPYLAHVAQPALPFLPMQTEFFDATQRSSLYDTDMPLQSQTIRQQLLSETAALHWLSQYQYLDVRTYLPGDILVKVDRASMLASLETRAPLLDHIVFEFMAKVPPQYKMTRRDSKILLKEALKGLLPPSIYRRDKRGFVIPLRDWLAKPLNPLLRDTLLDSTAQSRGLFRAKSVRRLIEDHTKGKADHQHRLWALLCFELWAREYGAA